MNALLAEYGAIWRAAVRPSWLRKLLWLALAALAGYRALAGNWNSVLAYCAASSAAALLLLYWVVLVPGAVLQNSPANARLVPRLRRRAMQMSIAFWLLCTALAALVADAVGGNAWLGAMGFAAWLIGFALNKAGYLHGLWFLLAPSAFVLLRSELPPAASAFATGAAGILGAALLLLALLRHAMLAIFPNGGDRHFALRSRQALALRTISGELDARDGQASSTSLYGKALQRDAARRGPPGTLLLHVLGPGGHWSESVPAMLFLLALAAAGKAMLMFTASPATLEAVPAIGWIVALPLLMLYGMGPRRFASRIGATTTEQALLRLSPLAPAMDRFNRQFGGALLRNALLEWLVVSTAIMGLTVLTGASLRVLLMQFCVCCLALPVAAAVLRDYARDASPRILYVMCWMLVAVLGGIGVGLAALRSSGSSLPILLSLTGIGAGVTAVLLRGHAMVRAPVAFPAARMTG